MVAEQKLGPLLKFSQWFGLAPFIRSPHGKFRVHTPALAYSVFVFMALLLQQCLIFLDWSGTAQLSANLNADLVDTYGFALTCLGSYIIHAYNFKKLSKMLNKTFSISLKFPRTSNFRNSAIIAIALGIAYEISFSVISIYVSPFEYANYWFYILETFTYVGLETVSFVIFLQFYHLVAICSEFFVEINKKFDKFVEKLASTPPTIHGLLLPNLRALLKERQEIYSLCCCINETFGLQNLLSVTLCFVEVTYACFNGLVNSINESALNLLSDTILWLGYFVLKLLVTLRVCIICSQESERLSIQLHRVFEYVHDDRWKFEIEQFSLALLHCDVEFDAFGFFSLNFSVLYSMLGVVTGFVVILVQSHSHDADIANLENNNGSMTN